MCQKNGVLRFCIKLNLRSEGPLESQYRGVCFERYLPFIILSNFLDLDMKTN